jgi:hypothetical protein
MTATTKATQLELELVTDGNVISHRHRPCSSVLDGVLAPGSIPGLDATLCRCEGCTKRAIAGVWWFDSWMRRRVMKRQIAYNFTIAAGDGLRDNE